MGSSWRLLLPAVGMASLAWAQQPESLTTISLEPEPRAETLRSEAAEPQRQIEEIIVTAQKTAQALEQVPLSITALDGDFLRDTAASDLAEVSTYVPNVRIDAHDIGSPQVFIRGFGTNAFNPSFESSVGFVQDEVYFGRPGYFTESLYDVERIEVLRGPQGTLFGKNTIAGVFSIHSRGVTDDWESDAQLTYAEHDARRLEVGSGGMLTERIGLRVAGLYRDEDGQLYNTRLDRDEESVRQAAGRLSLLFLPTEGVRAEFIANTSSTDAAFWPYQLGNLDQDTRDYLQSFDPQVEGDPLNFRTSMNTQGYIDKGSTSFGLKTSWSMGEVAGLSSLTPVLVLSSSRFYLEQIDDLDVSPADIAFLDTRQDHEQQSAELRFAGTAGSLFGWGDELEFVAGAFHYASDFTLLARAFAGAEVASYAGTVDALQLLSGEGGIGLPGGGGAPGLPVLGDLGSVVIGSDYFQFDYTQDVASSALFGQMSWKLDEHWVFTPGLRLNRERKLVDSAGRGYCPGKQEGVPRPCVFETLISGQDYEARKLRRKEREVSPKLSLQYFFDGGFNVYASYARGYKSGGFNSISFTGEDLEFEPEKAGTAELGVKGRALDDRLRYGVSLFHTAFDNLQVLAYNGVFFDVSNAASATSQGLEADFQWLTAWRPLSLTGSVGILDATYDDYREAPAPVGQGLGALQDLSGKRIAFAPRNSLTLTPTLDFPLRTLALRLAMDLVHQGEQYTDTDLDEATRVGGHTKFAARISLGALDERWALTLGGANLGDKRVANQVTDAVFFPGTYYAQQAGGRSLFASLRASF